jgi:hypothetical protein
VTLREHGADQGDAGNEHNDCRDAKKRNLH